MNSRASTATANEVQLAKGQVWQLQGCVLEVKRVGVRLVEFRLKKDAFVSRVQRRSGLGIQLEPIQVVAQYLKEHGAFLLAGEPVERNAVEPCSKSGR